MEYEWDLAGLRYISKDLVTSGVKRAGPGRALSNRAQPGRRARPGSRGGNWCLPQTDSPGLAGPDAGPVQTGRWTNRWTDEGGPVGGRTGWTGRAGLLGEKVKF